MFSSRLHAPTKAVVAAAVLPGNGMLMASHEHPPNENPLWSSSGGDPMVSPRRRWVEAALTLTLALACRRTSALTAPRAAPGAGQLRLHASSSMLAAPLLPLRLRGGMPKRTLDDQYEEEPAFGLASEEQMRARRVFRVAGRKMASARSARKDVTEAGAARLVGAAQPFGQSATGEGGGRGQSGDEIEGIKMSYGGATPSWSSQHAALKTPDSAMPSFALGFGADGAKAPADPENDELHGFEKEYQDWADAFCSRTAALSKDLLTTQRTIWASSDGPPQHVREALEVLCGNTSLSQSMSNLTASIRQLEQSFNEETSAIRLENEALRQELAIAKDKLRRAGYKQDESESENQSDPRAKRPATGWEGWQAGGTQGRGWGDVKRSKEGGLDVGSGGQTLVEPHRVSPPRARGASRSGVAGSIMVRGLCKDVTEAAILGFFSQATLREGGHGEDGSAGIKSVRLLPWKQGYPSRVAYVNFATAAAFHAAIDLDGSVPEWNRGSSLQIVRQESTTNSLAESRPDASPPGRADTSQGMSATRPGALAASIDPSADASLAGGDATTHFVAARADARNVAEGVEVGRSDGPLATSSLFGLPPLRPPPQAPLGAPLSSLLAAPGASPVSRQESVTATVVGADKAPAAGATSTPPRENQGLDPDTHTASQAVQNPFLQTFVPQAKNSSGGAWDYKNPFAGIFGARDAGGDAAVTGQNSVAPVSLRSGLPQPSGILGLPVNASSSLSNNPFLQAFTTVKSRVGETAAREGAAMPWGLEAQANATGLFKSMAPTSFFPPSQNSSAVNAFFPAAGVVGNAQEGEEEQAEAEEAQKELEIDPNQAIYKADQVDVKTGEEQEQTLFTLDKAKLFEYQKADDDAAVMDYRTQNQPLSSSFPFN